MGPVHSFPQYFFKTHFSVIVLSTHRLLSGSLKLQYDRFLRHFHCAMSAYNSGPFVERTGLRVSKKESIYLFIYLFYLVLLT